LCKYSDEIQDSAKDLKGRENSLISPQKKFRVVIGVGWGQGSKLTFKARQQVLATWPKVRQQNSSLGSKKIKV